MKKNIFLFVSIFITFNSIYSQEYYSKKWGIVWNREINLETYEKDREADAIIFFDIGESFFLDTDTYPGYNIRFTRTKRIKVLNNAGIKHANVSIPFYVDGFGESEIVMKIEAFAYNYENGKLSKTELDKSSIYEEKINDRWHAKRFAIPNVKKGTIIEFRYVLETPFLFNIPDWQFQDRIPTIYSEYTVRMIPIFEYSFITQGIRRFDYQKSEHGKHVRTWGRVVKSFGTNVGDGLEFQDMVHTYVMKDVPAFIDESYITSVNDYIMKIDFQLAKIYYKSGDSKEIMTNWAKMIEELTKDAKFGKQIKKYTNYAKKILKEDLNIKGLKPADLAQKIIEHVKSSYNWDGIYSKYSSVKANEFLTQKSGNSSDINLFLVALLQSAGIEAHPVIISTRGHGRIKVDYPYAHFFNHIIVVVQTDSQTFLCDATNNHIAYNRIPPTCINGKGLVINNTEDIKWAELNLNPLSYDFKTINLEIDPELLKANTRISIQATEYEAFEYRNTYKNDLKKLETLLLEGGFNTVNKLETKYYKETNSPYIIIGHGEVELEKIEDQIIISPFLNFPINENKLTQRKRSYPVDFIYSRDKAFHSIINIPNNYKIVSFPENFQLENDLAEINIEYLPSVNGIEVTAKYTFKKAVYRPNEYSRLKSFIDIIVRKFNESIVLEKI